MRRFVGDFDGVVGFDRKADNPPPTGCTYIPVDITSDASVREGLTVIRQHHGSHVASVVHLAAYYDFLGEPSPMYDKITVQGTERLLRYLREFDFQVDQFIFSSTMLVHRRSRPAHRRGLAGRRKLGLPGIQSEDGADDPRRARRHPCRAAPHLWRL